MWKSNEPSVWQEALDGYAEAIRSLGTEGLVELDRWFQEELPATLAARADDPHITREELVKLVEWKMTRNAWRPNHAMVKSEEGNTEALVQEKSRAALAALRAGGGGGAEPGEQAIRQALGDLYKKKQDKKLRGVGPATASAVLQAADPSVPFLSEEAMEAALGSKAYTEGKVLDLTHALRGKAAVLSKAGKRAWTAKDVEHALFAAAVAARAAASGGGSGKASGKGASGSGTKRRRV